LTLYVPQFPGGPLGFREPRLRPTKPADKSGFDVRDRFSASVSLVGYNSSSGVWRSGETQQAEIFYIGGFCKADSDGTVFTIQGWV